MRQKPVKETRTKKLTNSKSSHITSSQITKKTLIQPRKKLAADPGVKTTKPPGRADTQYCAHDSVKLHPSLTHYFSYCLYKSALLIRETLNQSLSQFGLIAPHLGMLRLLVQLGPMSQIDLGEQLGIDKATIVKMIDHLESLKYLTRKPDLKDRRIKFIEVTRLGMTTLDQASKIRQEVENEFLSVLTASEKEVLIQVIPKLLAKRLELLK